MASLIAALVLASGAGDRLATAKSQAAALDFPQALTTVREALEAGDASPAETVAIHALTGELAAAAGDRELARAELSRALTLDPHLDFSGKSPRIREPLAEARKLVGDKALAASANSTRSGEYASTTLTWTGDLFSLAAGTRVYVWLQARWQRADDPRRWRCVDPCRYWAAVIDSHGNELIWVGSPDAPLEFARLEHVAALFPETPSVAAQAPWYTRAGPYLAAAAFVLAALSAYFGARFAADQAALVDLEQHRSMHTMAEAFALDAARQRDRAFLFGGIAAAALAAGGAALTW